MEEGGPLCPSHRWYHFQLSSQIPGGGGRLSHDLRKGKKLAEGDGGGVFFPPFLPQFPRKKPSQFNPSVNIKKKDEGKNGQSVSSN